MLGGKCNPITETDSTHDEVVWPGVFMSAAILNNISSTYYTPADPQVSSADVQCGKQLLQNKLMQNFPNAISIKQIQTTDCTIYCLA